MVPDCATSGGPAHTYPTLAAANIRTLSSTDASIIRVAPQGAQVTIDCYVDGEAINGVTIWDHVITGGFISDTLMLTGSNSAVVPACPVGTIPTLPTLAPTAIRVQPTTASAVVKALATGELLTLDCYITGQSTGGSTVWDHVAGQGFVSDSGVLTGSATPVVAPCTLAALAPTPSISGAPRGSGPDADCPRGYVEPRAGQPELPVEPQRNRCRRRNLRHIPARFG